MLTNNQNAQARAHTNIALIKYWGKADENLFLPYTSSLSLTLDAFYTDTRVKIWDKPYDLFVLNGDIQDAKETEKLSGYIDLFRDLANYPVHVCIESYNHVPTAAGLASSSSAYAALAVALNRVFNLNMDQKQLSTYARRGSGSATRSIYGGFCEWQKGHSHESSYAKPLDPADWDIAMIVVTINDSKKAISSRSGMAHTVKTSPFYALWPEICEEQLEEIKVAIQNHNLSAIGEIMESNGMRMHATALAAYPPLCYFEAESLQVIQAVHFLRKEGYTAYFTMDAGPNVKILCPYSQSIKIQEQLSARLPKAKIIISKAGPDAYLLESWDYV